MRGPNSSGSRFLPWLLAGFAMTVLTVCLATVGATLTLVIGWWGPGLAVFIAAGVLALAMHAFRRDSRSRLG